MMDQDVVFFSYNIDVLYLPFLTQMERWIQMHYQIKEREEALRIAHNRELFYWVSGFYLTSLFGCFSFYQRTRRPVTLLPMVPLSFVMGYYADLAYGSKVHRIKGNYYQYISIV